MYCVEICVDIMTTYLLCVDMCRYHDSVSIVYKYVYIPAVQSVLRGQILDRDGLARPEQFITLSRQYLHILLCHSEQFFTQLIALLNK